MNSKRQKQCLGGFKELEMFLCYGIFSNRLFFYIEGEDILLGIGKEGVEMVFKQDCNQTI